MTGAGGVGGLLLVQESGNSYLPAYDGNGNVHAMIKASDGSIAAAYEYDAFGNTLRESGPYAASNPFRFSTKYTDTETSLVYYGQRYYSPWLGRFVCRDPKEEDGGRNLYAFLHNNAINHVDLLGWHSVDEDDYAGRNSGFIGSFGPGNPGGMPFVTLPTFVVSGSSSGGGSFGGGFLTFYQPGAGGYYVGDVVTLPTGPATITSDEGGNGTGGNDYTVTPYTVNVDISTTPIAVDPEIGAGAISSSENLGTRTDYIAGIANGLLNLVPVPIAGGYLPAGTAYFTPWAASHGVDIGSYAYSFGENFITTVSLGIGGVGSIRAAPTALGRIGAAESAATRALRLPATDTGLIGTRTLGYTTPNGSVFIRPGLPRAEQVMVMRHESIHAWFSPRGSGAFTTLRQNLGQWGYNNSQLLRYAEEAMAQGYATRSLMQGLRFPLANGYVTSGGLLLEGGAVGAGAYGIYQLENQ